MSDNAVHLRVIRKSRLVAALLSELDASKAFVIASDLRSGRTVQAFIKCEIQIPFDETQILLDTDVASESISCVCCYAGQRIEFLLSERVGQKWKLPSEVSLRDLRQDKRVAFAKRMFSAEIVLKSKAVYGYAVDLNKHYIAIDLDIPYDFTIGEEVKVIIRRIDSNTDIFYTACRIFQVQITTNQTSRVILSQVPNEKSSDSVRSSIRNVVNSVSMRIESAPFYDIQNSMVVSVVNVSTGGFTASIRNSSERAIVVPGVILNSEELGISFMVVWVKDMFFGAKPLLGDAECLCNWMRYISSIIQSADKKTQMSRKELADILTHSGLLKGSRRAPYGKVLSDHVVSTAHESPLVTHRQIIVDESMESTFHITARRISEYAWCVTDGAGTTSDPDSYTEVFYDCIASMVRVAMESPKFPRYFCSVLSRSVKSSDKILSDLKRLPNHLCFDSVHVSLSEFVRIGSFDSPYAILDIPNCSATERRKFINFFSPNLIDAILGGDGSHPILNGELSKMGPHHRVYSKVCILPGGGYVVAHRIVTHHIWSTTGVTNSVFVVARDVVEIDTLKQAIYSFSLDAISFGTDDVLLIIDGVHGLERPYLEAFSTSRIFEFHLHDLLNSPSTQSSESELSKLQRGRHGG